MKIIQITDHNGNGGVNSFVYDLCESQIKLGNEVMFVSIIDYKERATKEGLEQIKKRGVKLCCLGAQNKLVAVLHYTVKLRSIIKDFAGDEPCVCNLHLKLSVLMGVLSTRGLKNITIVETYHNNYSYYHLQYAVLHPWIKQYIAISETCGKEMKRRFHTSSKRMSVIPNGVDREKIRSIALVNPEETRQGTRYVTVGRLSFEKNITSPVKAFSNYCREGVEYIVIGDGPERDEVHKLAANNPCIIFKGELQRQDTLRNLATADIVIMPSLWEGRSILQLEAMSLDKPMMLSDVPALREVFEEKSLTPGELYRKCSWGYLVQTSNPNSYRAAAEDFLHTTKIEREEMAYYVKQASLKNDIMVMARKYQAVYNCIMRNTD